MKYSQKNIDTQINTYAQNKYKNNKSIMKKTALRRLLALFALGAMVLTLFAGYGTAQAASVEDDAENPSDVEGLEAEALNGAVRLTWDEATDDTGIVGYQVHYGLSSVDEPGESYDFNEDVGDTLEFVVEELENDTTYYFSVIAYDGADPRNESLAWATEASATPSDDLADPNADDSEAPEVTDAEAVDNVTVRVEFSEGVVLPSDNPEDAFVIENEDFEPLEVTAAELDPEDNSDATVLLTTTVQDPEQTYTITVSIDVADKAGNPIISGTSDTAEFDGTDQEPAEEEPETDDTTPPVLESVEVIDEENIILNFSETIILGIDPAQNFRVLATDDNSELTFLGVQLGDNSDGVEDASALVTTAPQEAKEYLVIVSGITDEAGNEIETADASLNFQGTGSGGEDNGNVDPDNETVQEVANFLAGKIFDAGQYLVTLTWQIPENQASTILEQIVYLSTDGENYEQEAVLDPDVTEYKIDGLSFGEYWFKVTQKDEEGNETEGVVSKLILPETGPGMAGLMLGSVALGRMITRRKKRNKKL